MTRSQRLPVQARLLALLAVATIAAPRGASADQAALSLLPEECDIVMGMDCEAFLAEPAFAPLAAGLSQTLAESRLPGVDTLRSLGYGFDLPDDPGGSERPVPLGILVAKQPMSDLEARLRAEGWVDAEIGPGVLGLARVEGKTKQYFAFNADKTIVFTGNNPERVQQAMALAADGGKAPAADDESTNTGGEPAEPLVDQPVLTLRMSGLEAYAERYLPLVSSMIVQLGRTPEKQLAVENAQRDMSVLNSASRYEFALGLSGEKAKLALRIVLETPEQAETAVGLLDNVIVLLSTFFPTVGEMRAKGIATIQANGAHCDLVAEADKTLVAAYLSASTARAARRQAGGRPGASGPAGRRR